MQGKPSLWNSILEAEENEDDVERFQDLPDLPTHALGSEATQTAEAEGRGQGVSRSEEHAEPGSSEEEAEGEDEQSGEEEDGDGDMGPSTSGRGHLEDGAGLLRQSAPAGLQGTAATGYDMRKRYWHWSVKHDFNQVMTFTCTTSHATCSTLHAVDTLRTAVWSAIGASKWSVACNGKAFTRKWQQYNHICRHKHHMHIHVRQSFLQSRLGEAILRDKSSCSATHRRHFSSKAHV